MPDDNFTITICVVGLAALLYSWLTEPTPASVVPSLNHPCVTVPV